MRKYLITGLIILMPIALTLFLVGFLVDLFTNPFLEATTGVLQNLGLFESIAVTTFFARLCILILLCVAIVLLGIVGRHFLFKTIIGWTEKLFSKIPLVKTIFKTTRDIATAFLSLESRRAFRRPLIAPFPTRNSFAIGFETGEVPKECQNKVKEPLTSIFIPTSPHPISGFMILIPKELAKEVKMTNEEALLMTVSCGMLRPEDRPSPEEKK